VPSKFRVTTTVPKEVKDFLEAWADAENRSVSNLAATILIDAVKEKQKRESSRSSWDVDDLATKCTLTAARIQEIKNGSKPSPDEIVALARALEISIKEFKERYQNGVENGSMC